MAHSSSFGVANANDFFHQIVRPQHIDFLANNASPRHALLAIIVAYHMFDWVHGRKFTVRRFKQEYPSNKALSDVFDLARKISNDAKHFLGKVQTPTQQPGGFSSVFSYAFARSLIVRSPDDTEQSADVILRQMVDFWTEQENAGAF